MAEYGSPAAAFGKGIQAAMLQRAALQRQAMLDDLARRQAEANMANQAENTASLAAARQSNAQKDILSQLESTVPIGTELSPEQEAEIRKLPGGFALIGAPKPGAPIPEPTAPAPPAALASNEEVAAQASVPPALAAEPTLATPGQVPPALAAPGPSTFAGTTKQKEKAAQLGMLQKIVDDPNTSPEIRAWAQGQLSGGNMPAGIAAPKSATESAAEHQQHIESLYAKRERGKAQQRGGAAISPENKLTPDEEAEIKANEEFRTKPAVTNFNMNEPFKENKAVGAFYNSQQAAIDRMRTPIAQQTERAVRALDSLDNPSMVSDAVVAPEFLTVIAGGFGTGLRMSEAELSRINMSQNRWDQLKGEFNKWRTGSQPVIQPAMREEMKKILGLAMQRAERKLNMYDDYLGKMADADSIDELKELAAKLRKEDSKLTTGDPEAFGFGPEAKGGAAAKPGATGGKKTPQELYEEYRNKPEKK